MSIVRYIVFAIAIAAAHICSADNSMESIKVAYLSDNTIYVVALDARKPAAYEVSSWALPRERHENYAALSCGPGDTLLLHVTQIEIAQDRGSVRAEIVAANLGDRSLTRLHPRTATSLTWPKLSPDGMWIAATANVDGRGAFALVSTKSGAIEILETQGSGSPNAWSPSGDTIYLTTLDETGKKWEISAFNRADKSLRRIHDGGRPTISTQTGAFAYLSSDRRMISIVNPHWSQITQFNGFFKDLIEWVDESRVLYVTGVGYVDELGIANLVNGETRTSVLPSRGEISGGCVLR